MLDRVRQEHTTSTATSIDETCRLLRLTTFKDRPFERSFVVIAPDDPRAVTNLAEMGEALGIEFAFLLLCPPPVCTRCGKSPCDCATQPATSDTVFTRLTRDVQQFAGHYEKDAENYLKSVSNYNDYITKPLRKFFQIGVFEQYEFDQLLKAVNLFEETQQGYSNFFKELLTRRITAICKQFTEIERIIKARGDDSEMRKLPCFDSQIERQQLKWRGAHCPACRYQQCVCHRVHLTNRALQDSLALLEKAPDQLRAIINFYQGWMAGINARLIEMVDAAQYTSPYVDQTLNLLGSFYREYLDKLFEEIGQVQKGQQLVMNEALLSLKRMKSRRRPW